MIKKPISQIKLDFKNLKTHNYTHNYNKKKETMKQNPIYKNKKKEEKW